jgi:hypothetical protein
VRHNIVGVPNPKTGDVKKDYILPVNLLGADGEAAAQGAVLEALPLLMRSDAQFSVENLADLEPSPLLQVGVGVGVVELHKTSFYL